MTREDRRLRTQRRNEIACEMIRQGYSREFIASVLGVAERTISSVTRNEIRNRERMEVHNRNQLIKMLAEYGVDRTLLSEEFGLSKNSIMKKSHIYRKERSFLKELLLRLIAKIQR